MKRFALILATGLILHSFTTASSYVFVLQSGKQVSGVIVLEEDSLYRIRDANGIEMRVKKSQLDAAATRQANVPKPVVVARAELVDRSGSLPARVFTNRDVVSTQQGDELLDRKWNVEELTGRVKVAEQDYHRLSIACRSAGATSAGVKTTEYFEVNGRMVAVTGKYADPHDIAQAKSICQKAMKTGSFLDRAKKLLQQLISAAQ